jgi:tetratricopeptide (TPR) repeat protein
VIAPQPPLDAYRADCHRLSATLDEERESLMVGWLAYTELLERRVQGAASARNEESHRQASDAWAEACRVVREYRLAAVTAFMPAEPDDAAMISTLTRRIADAAEQHGALHQAFAMLCILEGLGIEATGTLEWGRVLAQRARVARKADAPEVAKTLYAAVRRLGRTTRSSELLARADVGFGVLAQYRGNVPEARRRYEAAARVADRAGLRELSRLAHHGMMVIAVRAKGYAEALVHGWGAFRDAEGDADLEAESLLNLAQLAFDLGEPQAALSGFTAALSRTSLDRLTLPALGGAARAAAAVGDEHVRRLVEQRFRERRRSSGLSYQESSALLEFAMAHAAAGDAEAARRAADEAQSIARRHAFHELDHAATQLLERLAGAASSDFPTDGAVRRIGVRERPQLADDAEDVLRKLAALPPPDTLLALPQR